MSRDKRRLVILAQFDPQGGLPAHVRIHLERLRPLARDLVLVSNSSIDAAGLKTARALCDRVLVRDNIGWDFAAWRDALSAYDMRQWDEVVLTNSSIVGPLFPLEPIFEQMDERACDFWGMAHSRHRGSHLQSYFLVFNKSVVSSKAWKDFWAGVRNVEDKADVIASYEVGLTQALEKAGFRYDSFIPNPSFLKSLRFVRVGRIGQIAPILKDLRIPWSVNHVHKAVELHEDLIAAGMPYLKASLLWGKDVYRRKPLETLKSTPGVKYPWAEIGF